MLSGSDELSQPPTQRLKRLLQRQHSSSICMAAQHRSPETELEQAYYSADTLADEDDEIIFL